MFRKIIITLVIIATLTIGLFIYLAVNNTGFFMSMFCWDYYSKPVCEVRYDTLLEENKVAMDIDYTFDATYAADFEVSEQHFSPPPQRNSLEGEIKFTFTSNGGVVYKKRLFHLNHIAQPYMGIFTLSGFGFKLPFPNEKPEDLTLEIELIEPFPELASCKEHVVLRIAPVYVK